MLVPAIFMSVIATRKKAVEAAGAGEDSEKSKGDKYLGNFAQVLYIRYPITFRKKFIPVLVLFDSGSEVNAIYPTFA